MNFYVKYLVTAAVVVVVSELAKRSGKLGGAVAALPLVTVLTMIWLYIEKQSVQRISDHAYYTFWYVIPSLPMFLMLPYLLNKFNFWLALGLAGLIALFGFIVLYLILSYFDINLL